MEYPPSSVSTATMPLAALIAATFPFRCTAPLQMKFPTERKSYYAEEKEMRQLKSPQYRNQDQSAVWDL